MSATLLAATPCAARGVRSPRAPRRAGRSVGAPVAPAVAPLRRRGRRARRNPARRSGARRASRGGRPRPRRARAPPSRRGGGTPPRRATPLTLTGVAFGDRQNGSLVTIDGYATTAPVQPAGWSDTQVCFTLPLQHPNGKQWSEFANTIVQLGVLVDGQRSNTAPFTVRPAAGARVTATPAAAASPTVTPP